MSEDHLEREVLGKVRMDRRNFIKKAIVGTAFVMPAIASFDMLAMSGSADGTTTCVASNQQSGGAGTGTTGGAGGTRKRNNTDGACGGTPDGGTGGAAGAGGASDRAIKTDVTPVGWD